MSCILGEEMEINQENRRMENEGKWNQNKMIIPMLHQQNQRQMCMQQ